MKKSHLLDRAVSLLKTKSVLPVTGAVMAALFFSLFILTTYLSGPVNGNFNYITLPAKMFGIPEALKAKGIEPLYLGKTETGWDGQFYYSISNDLFAQKDTPLHVDADAYRYQRIGLPLFANIVSKLTFQSWVSPATYYASALFLLLVAVGFGAKFFNDRGMPAITVLLWALAAGTQITMLNGLPDQAADAFCILGLLALLKDRKALFALLMTFAALSREIYLLLPCMVCLGIFVYEFKQVGFKRFFKFASLFAFIKSNWLYVVPVAVVGLWQTFIRLRFVMTPSEQATEILGLPLVSHFKHLLPGVMGKHWLVGTGNGAYFEGYGVLLFMLLVFLSLYVLIGYLARLWRNGLKTREHYLLFSVATGFTAILLTYLCFGKTVMMHFTGYFKAANIFLFIIPFVAALEKKKLKTSVLIFLIIVFGFFSKGLWDRVSGPPYFETYLKPANSVVYATTQPACLKEYKASVELVSIDDFSRKRGIRRFFTPGNMIFHVKVTNTSAEPFVPFQGNGTFNLAAHWVDEKGTLVTEGHRTVLPKILPKETIDASVIVPFPKKSGKFSLKISPVQEGCAWFYLKEPKSAYSLPYALM